MNDTYDKIKFINNLLSNLQKDQNFETSLLQVSDEMKFSNMQKRLQQKWLLLIPWAMFVSKPNINIVDLYVKSNYDIWLELVYN